MSASQIELERTIQALNYFLNKRPNKVMSKMKLLKLLWLADRYAMRQYGYTLTNDEYWAMQWGSIGTTTKEILDGKKHSDYIDKYIEVVSNRTIKSVAPVDLDEFSEIDLKVLEAVWNVYGGMTASQLSDYCHQFPEWERHKEKIEKIGGSYRENIDDFFSDPKTPPKHDIFNQDEATLELSWDALEEDQKLRSLLS